MSRNLSLSKSIMLCLVAGLMLGLSQPLCIKDLIDVTPAQDYLGLLALVAYAPMFWAIAEQNLKRAFLLSSLTITMHHTIGLYWIYIALNVHGHVPPLPSALITLCLPLLLAVKGAMFLTLGRFLAQRYNRSFFLIAPFALCVGEYFRNFYIFGGFPWGNAGYAIGRVTEFRQLASLVGVYGLVLFVGAVSALLCLACERRAQAMKYGACTILLVALVYVFGVFRLSGAENEFAPTVRIALLQGNIPQEVKAAARLRSRDILDIYLGLVRTAKKQGAELIVWPESSHPRLLDKEVHDLDFGFEDRAASIIGAVVYGDNPDGSYYVHNAGFITDFRGAVVKRYDKSHLVPFGEYVPWPMSGIVDRIVPGIGAFKPGVELVPTKVQLSLGKELSVGTTVCYEGIFPEITRSYAQAKDPAELLVNLTNDAWYGYSSAPFQHLLMYRLRSVESGLPFVRATNTGVSAWIDVYGREHQATTLYERTTVIADIPLLRKKTVYAAVGDIIPMLSVLLFIIGYVAAVLPLDQFVRKRQWRKILILAVLVLIPMLSSIYFARPEFLTDEASRTKNGLIFVLCVLLMVGLLSKTKRSRSILITAASVIVFTSIALAIFESFYFLLGLPVGLLIYLLAFRIKKGEQPIK